VGDTGIEPVTSSVSGKRATAAPIARNRKAGIWDVRKRADDEIRTRDIHLGKVVLYQLSYVRVCSAPGRGRWYCMKQVSLLGGRYWDRTSDLFRVREARYRCANRPCSSGGCPENHGFHRGGYGIRTRVYGFAGRCLASRPTHRVSAGSKNPCRDSVLRADDEIRTRDIHLGKVVLYQLSYVRILEG
jgi:hypothetical protein